MTKKRKLRITDDVEMRYQNWASQLVSIMKPWSIMLIFGRASAKTVQIMAERTQDVVVDCPGAPFAWVADTYSNLHKNIIPSLIDGLNLLGWRLGEHFVIDQKPPKEWEDKMYNKSISYKGMMVFYNGFNFTFISLDRPSIGAGRSYVGVFGDEVKYFPEEKITNLMKAVRGFRVKYGNSPWYRTRNFTTDMPNPNHLGEYDWILKYFKQNDKERLLLLMKVGLIFNDVKKEYVAVLQEIHELEKIRRTDSDARKRIKELERTLKNCEKNMQRWEERWIKARRGVTFAFICSSFVNVDILGTDWFSDEIKEGMEGLSCNVLSIIPKLEASKIFYCNLGMKHFYSDGNLNEVIEKHPYGWEQDCSVLRYLDSSKPLEGGMDAGNMLSLVLGQKKGKTMRILKELYTLPPNNIRDLADMFLEYFRPHKHKVLKLYYDRAMNNYKRVGSDLATQIKNYIEFDREGNKTGWVVQLMSLKQGNVGSNMEYRFFSSLLAGDLKESLFELLIDLYNCPNLKSEMEVTETSLVTDKRTNASTIVKKKTGDKLPLNRLAKESTNLTDALKYLICRNEYVRIWNNGRKTRAVGWM